MKTFAILLNVFTVLIVGMVLYFSIPVINHIKLLVLILIVITPPVNLFVFFNKKINELLYLIILHFKIICPDENKKRFSKTKVDSPTYNLKKMIIQIINSMHWLPPWRVFTQNQVISTDPPPKNWRQN